MSTVQAAEALLSERRIEIICTKYLDALKVLKRDATRCVELEAALGRIAAGDYCACPEDKDPAECPCACRIANNALSRKITR